MKRFFLLLFTAVITAVSFAQKEVKTAEPKSVNTKGNVSNTKATGETPGIITPKIAALSGKPAGADPKPGADNFTIIKRVAATPVKNQAATGTCWSFSTTSLVESQAMKNNSGEIDLSEMFTVRNIYIEKAKNYILRQGHTQFSEGGLGHDQVRAIALYGAVPETVYNGLKAGKTSHDHQKLFTDLKTYLDSLILQKPLPGNWLNGYIAILDSSMGVPPLQFGSMGEVYSPQSFAKNVLKFNANDYVNITSFTHHPYYEPFVLEVPDNFSNGAYYNLPLNEMIQLSKDALMNGYSLMWDADVSNIGFSQENGVAVTAYEMGKGGIKNEVPSGDAEEVKLDAKLRQTLFENLTTQDDHLMHITGLGKSSAGKPYFLVKNSWGEVGPYKGYINVSEAYFAINTISLVVPKAALSKVILEKLKIK